MEDGRHLLQEVKVEEPKAARPLENYFNCNQNNNENENDRNVNENMKKREQQIKVEATEQKHEAAPPEEIEDATFHRDTIFSLFSFGESGRGSNVNEEKSGDEEEKPKSKEKKTDEEQPEEEGARPVTTRKREEAFLLAIVGLVLNIFFGLPCFGVLGIIVASVAVHKSNIGYPDKEYKCVKNLGIASLVLLVIPTEAKLNKRYDIFRVKRD